MRAAVEAFFSTSNCRPTPNGLLSSALGIADRLGWDLPVDQLDSRRLLESVPGTVRSAKPAT